MADEVQYTKPNSQLDLEARLERKNENPDVHVPVAVNPNPVGEEEYIGTDPIYQNYANETEKPLAGDGAEQQVVEDFKKSALSHRDGQDEAQAKAQEVREEQVDSDAQGPFASNDE
jgi:hypothetical protein